MWSAELLRARFAMADLPWQPEPRLKNVFQRPRPRRRRRAGALGSAAR